MGTIRQLSSQFQQLNSQFKQISAQYHSGEGSSKSSFNPSSGKFSHFMPSKSQDRISRVSESDFKSDMKSIAANSAYQVAWAVVSLAKLPLAMGLDLMNQASIAPINKCELSAPVSYKMAEVKVSQIAKLTDKAATLAEQTEALIAELPDSAERDTLIKSLDDLLSVSVRATARSKEKKSPLQDGLVKIKTHYTHKRSLASLDRVIKVKSSITSQLKLQTPSMVENRESHQTPEESGKPKSLAELAAIKVATTDELYHEATEFSKHFNADDIMEAIDRHRSEYEEYETRLSELKNENFNQLRNLAQTDIQSKKTEVKR